MNPQPEVRCSRRVHNAF